MKRMPKIRTASGLFLMELICAILIFSIAGASCITVFITSRRLSRTAEELSLASAMVRNTAESLRGNETLVPSSKTWLNDRFEPCEKADAAYLFTVETTQNETLETAQLSVVRATPAAGMDDTVYELTVQHHVKEVPDAQTNRD